METKLIYKISAILTVITISFLVSTNTIAADEIEINNFNGANHISPGGIISASDFGWSGSYSGNSFLNNSAFGVIGDWYIFKNEQIADVNVTVNGDLNLTPGLSVWASGATAFDGGTLALGQEVSTSGFNTPFSFNATSTIGASGTLWMTDPSVAAGGGGNLLETLGYALSGATHLNSVDPTGWGEDIVTGAHDVSITNTYRSSFTGNTDAHSASLTLHDLNPGWYTVYVGGAENLAQGGSYDLVVSAVPEAKTWVMLLVGLGFISLCLRKQNGAFRIAT